MIQHKTVWKLREGDVYKHDSSFYFIVFMSIVAINVSRIDMDGIIMHTALHQYIAWWT